MPKLTHLNRKGEAAMVDVSAKPPVRREAVAEGRIVLAPATLDLIRKNQIKKGDVLSIARIAGIQAAKQTQYLIPLCHQIPLSKVQVEFELRAKAVHITATAITVAPDRCRNGGAHGREHRRADDLRHVQGGRQKDAHRGRAAREQDQGLSLAPPPGASLDLPIAQKENTRR
jgi:molybdenum cofactor biosynthesis protein MoaC